MHCGTIICESVVLSGTNTVPHENFKYRIVAPSENIDGVILLGGLKFIYPVIGLVFCQIQNKQVEAKMEREEKN